MHRKFLNTKQKLQGDDDYESEEAMRCAVKNENISF